MNTTVKQRIGYDLSANGIVNTVYRGKVELNSFHEATYEETDAAIKKAAIAFPLYGGMNGNQRAAFLETIAKHIAATGDALIGVTRQETGLPEARLQAERQRTISQLQLFAGLLKDGSWIKAIIDTGFNDPIKPDTRQMQVPLGVAAVFGASNFPYAFSVAGGDTVSALAAGCTVVHKANPAHPVTAEVMAGCILRAAKDTRMPDGVFSLLHGAAHKLGADLVMHPLVKAVGFTGSFKGGMALFDMAMKRSEPIPVFAEMGSVNPVFILPAMLRQQGNSIAWKLAASNTLGVGQFCTNPGLFIIVRSEETDRFIKDYVESIQKIAGQPMLSDNICNAYFESAVHLEGTPGVEVLTILTENDNSNIALPQVFKVSGDDFLNSKTLQEEVFGPSSLIVVAENRTQLMAIAEYLTGQLTASVWATQADCLEYAPLFIGLQYKAGRIIYNDVPTGVEVNHSMVHGGPHPATTDSRTTSVGTQAIYRFTRPVCFQDFPNSLLPDALRNENRSGTWRQVNGSMNNMSI